MRKTIFINYGKLQTEHLLTKKFYCLEGFLNFDWCFQRNASLFGTLHRGGGSFEHK